MSERVIGPSFDPDGPGYELGRCSDPPGESYTAADRSYDLWAFAKDYGAEDFEADADEAGLRPR